MRIQVTRQQLGVRVNTGGRKACVLLGNGRSKMGIIWKTNGYTIGEMKKYVWICESDQVE